MNTMIDDIIVYIMNFLCDKDKINFLSLSKDLHKIKNKVHYEKMIDSKKICGLFYYDMFTNVRITEPKYKIPKSTTHLIFGDLFDSNNTSFSEENELLAGLSPANSYNEYYIPNSVTHLSFGD